MVILIICSVSQAVLSGTDDWRGFLEFDGCVPAARGHDTALRNGRSQVQVSHVAMAHQQFLATVLPMDSSCDGGWGPPASLQVSQSLT